MVHHAKLLSKLVNHNELGKGRIGMNSGGLWIALAIVIVVVIYTFAKVRAAMRKSDRQWRNVDKSKLREWRDEDDW
jgi:hypothetical protein